MISKKDDKSLVRAMTIGGGLGLLCLLIAVGFILFILSGCGYRIIRQSDLGTLRALNQSTGYMKCLNGKKLVTIDEKLKNKIGPDYEKKIDDILKGEK